MDETRLLWYTSETTKLLARLLRDLEAGLTPSVAFEVAFTDVDRLYRKTCAIEQIPQINHMLDPASVELNTRFALDALFGALKGEPDEAGARKAFWTIFRRVTLPSLTPTR